jgi:cyclophilin family peptidyl-prolyl cis-trans isomerase
MKRARLLFALIGLSVSIVAHTAEAERVRVTTNVGAFVIELQRDRAPLTVENFLNYVRTGQYTSTLIHRVISGFVIQGGGMSPDYKLKPVQKPIPNESGNGLKNLRGTVGLARAAGPHSGDAQFYVNVADNGDLDPLPTRWGYAVFGRVVEGMDIVDHISEMPTGPMGPLKSDAPLQPVIIQKVELLNAAPAAAPAPAPAPASESVPPPAGASEQAPAEGKPVSSQGEATSPQPTPQPKPQ